MPVAQLDLPADLVHLRHLVPARRRARLADKVSHFFPLSHIVNAFGSCFVPGATGSQFHGDDLLAIAIWTAVGLFVAVRRFRWEP